MEKQKIEMTEVWDKTFPQSANVKHSKVQFPNIYGITLVADLYIPIKQQEKMPAIAISGPFGAVKEQSSGLYAQELAERGFIALAFDPSFTGESGGEPRYMASPDINTEDFCAAVDFLSTNPAVDASRIGVLGICGWGGMAINAAAVDTRIKVTVASTMYDMTRFRANGYFDADNSAEKRYATRERLCAQRTEDFKNGNHKLAGGLPAPEQLTGKEPQFVKEYVDYYKTKRGYHVRSLNSNNGWSMVSLLAFINCSILLRSDEIRSAVLVVHGEKAHSRYFGEDAFKKLKGDNKKLYIVPGATHTDLYDRKDVIPFDEIEDFLRKNLK